MMQTAEEEMWWQDKWGRTEEDNFAKIMQQSFSAFAVEKFID
jgi:hypothetical protein